MIARSSFRSKKLMRVSEGEHLLFYGLVLESDDEGRGEGDPETLVMCFPNRRWTEEEVEVMMTHLADVGLIDWYTIDGGQYYAIRQWMKYQEGSWHGRSAKPSLIPEGKHQERCSRTPSVVTPNTIPAPKLSKEKLSKEKRREWPPAEARPHITELINKAREIKGWTFNLQQDSDFFARLLESYPQPVIERTIEDLRVYQEKPAKQYKNLQSTLRGWCSRATPEGEPRKPDVPLDDVGKPMTFIDGKWWSDYERDKEYVKAANGWKKREA